MSGKLLLIEDDLRLAQMVGDYLRQSGFDNVHAGDGQSGLARMQEGDIDLVVLDLMLPDMDGLQALVDGTLRGAKTVSIQPTGSDSYEVILSISADTLAYLVRALRGQI